MPWAVVDLVIPERRVYEMGRITQALEAMPPQTKLLWAKTAGGEYPVYIGPGLLGGAGDAAFGPTSWSRAGASLSPTTTPAACTPSAWSRWTAA